MIVMGIDPGIARVGYGVIAVEEGRISSIVYGCIRTAEEKRSSQRLLEIYTALDRLIGEHRPDCLAVERLFFARNISSAMRVSEVCGVIHLLAEQRRIPVAEYTPNQVKQAITGSGRADKRQMQDMIQRLLRLDTLPKPDDAADGLSIALCHIHVMR